MSGWYLVFTIAAGVASIVGLCVMFYQIGKRSKARRAKQISRTTNPDREFESLLRQSLELEPADVDVLGYSVHAISDIVRPLMRRALEAQKRLRVLVLNANCDGFEEKSRLEQPTQEIGDVVD